MGTGGLGGALQAGGVPNGVCDFSGSQLGAPSGCVTPPASCLSLGASGVQGSPWHWALRAAWGGSLGGGAPFWQRCPCFSLAAQPVGGSGSSHSSGGPSGAAGTPPWVLAPAPHVLGGNWGTVPTWDGAGRDPGGGTTLPRAVSAVTPGFGGHRAPLPMAPGTPRTPSLPERCPPLPTAPLHSTYHEDGPPSYYDNQDFPSAHWDDKSIRQAFIRKVGHGGLRAGRGASGGPPVTHPPAPRCSWCSRCS